MADKESTSEVMEVTQIPPSSGVAQGNDPPPLEEEECWVTPGKNVDFTYLISKNNNLKQLHETQNGYIAKLDKIVEKEILPKLLKNNPIEVKTGVTKITELIGYMKSNMKLANTISNDLVKGINITKSTGELLRKTTLPPKDRLRKRALFQDSRRKGLANVSENPRKRRASSPLSSNDNKKQTTEVIDISQDNIESDGNGNEENTEPYYKTKKRKNRKKEDTTPRRQAQKGKKKPATDAIKITAQSGASYADILRNIKSGIQKPDDLVGFRRTKKEDILIVLKKGGKAEELKNSLTALVDGKAEVVTLTSKPRKMILEIRHMDESTCDTEVTEALQVKLGRDVGDIGLKIYRGYGHTKTAVFTVPELDGENLLKDSRIAIGWNMCRVRKRVEVTQCCKCLGFGHTRAKCNGPERKGACWKCGQEGHQKKKCNNNPKCFACESKGFECEHIQGSRRCQCFSEERRKLQSRNG